MTEQSHGYAPLHQDMARELGIEIINGVWETGSTVLLEDLQQRFGVSRTVAREASQTLESMGMVMSKRRVGIVAQPSGAWKVLDSRLIDWRLRSSKRDEQLFSLTQLRMAVEPAAAEGAARHESAHVRAGLLPVASEMRRAGEAGLLDEYLELDISFHTLVLRASGNELFAAMADVVAIVLRGRTEQGLMPSQPAETSLAAHEAVAEAIFRGDSAAARMGMHQVIDEVREALGVDPVGRCC